MKIYWYWSYKSIPELADLPEKERRIIWRHCMSKASRRWRTWVGIILIAAGIVVLACLLLEIWRVDSFITAVIGGGCIGFIAGQYICAIARKYVTECLNSYRQAAHTDDS